MTLFDETVKVFGEMVQKVCAELQKIADQLSKLFGDTPDGELPTIKPYHRRGCGRKYSTPNEVRFCMKQHQAHGSSPYAGGKVHGKYSGVRIFPRNREATMRATEIRRQRQSAGTTGAKYGRRH